MLFVGSSLTRRNCHVARSVKGRLKLGARERHSSILTRFDRAHDGISSLLKVLSLGVVRLQLMPDDRSGGNHGESDGIDDLVLVSRKLILCEGSLGDEPRRQHDDKDANDASCEQEHKFEKGSPLGLPQSVHSMFPARKLATRPDPILRGRCLVVSFLLPIKVCGVKNSLTELSFYETVAKLIPRSSSDCR